jgi:pilus assembly protein CpaB
MLLRLVLLIGAIGAGGIAAWLVLAARPEPVTKIVQEAPATQDVLVAASDLLPAQTLTKENLRWQPWPESTLNPVYITRSSRSDAIDSLAGAIVRNHMAAGEPIQQGNLAPRHAGYLSTVLPAGKRAMAVHISPETTAGGFILPNDRVDVLHSDKNKDGSPTVNTILSNVRVLAIDQAVEDTNKNENSKANVIGKTATLELDPTQAEILTAHGATGMLSLSLRSAADNDDFSNRQVVIIRAGQKQSANMPF